MAGRHAYASRTSAIAGTKAFRQAYDACMKGEWDLKKYAKDNKLEELGVSLGMMELAHDGLKKIMKDKK